MKGILLDIEGNWGHFRKPETNNNPLTHDFITKTAMIGLIGATLGIERKEMASLFPQLSDDLLYGVQVNRSVKKESWAFTLRGAVNLFDKAPKQMEFLRKPYFTAAVALQDERSSSLFSDFSAAIKQSEARFTPVLGLHNCPAELRPVASGEFQMKHGDFKTKGFIKGEHKLNVGDIITQGKGFRLGVERIPTYQNDDFWNLPERYVKVVYPTEGREIYAAGEYYEFTDGSQWALI